MVDTLKDTPTPETNPTPTPEPKVTPDLSEDLAAMTTERDQLAAKVNGLTADVEGVTGNLTAARLALATVHRGALLNGAIDPDVLGLAPKLELGDDLAPTPDSVATLKEWRESKAHFFAKPKAAPSEPPAPNPSTSTPVPDPKGEAMTRAKWDKLRSENPAQFRKDWPKYVAWVDANER